MIAIKIQQNYIVNLTGCILHTPQISSNYLVLVPSLSFSKNVDGHEKKHNFNQFNPSNIHRYT